MSILVTGGTGYIGSHTVVKLLEANHDVVIIDNLCNSKKEVLNHIQTITGKLPTFIEGDLCDESLVTEIFKTQTIDAVIHFAGLKAVGESVAMPIKYYDNNIGSTIVLLKVMEQFGCKKLVFSSSATVYGMNENVPFSEDFPLSTTNPYGATKHMIEDILRDVYKSDNDYSIALLRYFNPIGAHTSGLIGENPNDIPNNLLPYVAKVATGELACLSVFGNDYDTIDGTGVRDYIHVLDLAEGHLKALDFVMTHNVVEAINLGTGNGYSVLEVISAFEKASGKTVNYKIVDQRPGDIGNCYANAAKAKALLGWEAHYDINQMCADSWRFAHQNTNQSL